MHIKQRREIKHILLQVSEFIVFISKHSHQLADKSLIFDVRLWYYRVGHQIETSPLVFSTQRHEIASPLFHFLSIRPCYLLFLGQLFFSEYTDRQDGVSLSLAQRGSTSLTYYSPRFTSPGTVAGRWEQKYIKNGRTVESKSEKRQKQIDTPWLWKLGLIVCGKKVVIEVGASPWKSARVTEWKQWQLWWGLLDLGLCAEPVGPEMEQWESLLWRHWSNMVFSTVMWCTEGADKNIL